MGRLCCILLLAITIAACDRDSGSSKFSANIGCTTATVLDRLQPGPGIAFIADTGKALPRWRAAVGPAVSDRAGRSCEDAPIDSLLVVSWNVHIGHADIRRFVSDLRSGHVLPGVRVRHFVILMQEAFRRGDGVPAQAAPSACPKRMGGEGPDIEDLSDTLAMALFYVPSMRNGCDNGTPEDRGNAILSTLPLTNLQAVELPLVRQRRVAALADVKGHTAAGINWTLSLASVHFENRGPGRPRDWEYGRAKQARALAAALPEAQLAAVGGDFNTLFGSREPAVRIMGARFSNIQTHQSSITYVSYVVVRTHIDYMFFRGVGNHRSKYWRARARYGSDHYPIMGFVRVG